jgi:hypothetical protein
MAMGLEGGVGGVDSRQEQKCFSASSWSDRLWGPPSLLSGEYRWAPFSVLRFIACSPADLLVQVHLHSKEEGKNLLVCFLSITS